VIAAATACGRGEGRGGASGGVVREAQVARGELASSVLLTGQLRAASATDLIVPKTEVWQLTIRWMAEDGVRVTAGERVLEFDNSSFTNGLREKQLQLLEATSAARTAADLAALQLAGKRSELEQHRIALAKATLLASVPEDLVSQRTLQERQLEQARAQAAVTRAEKELAAEQQASALEARVKQLELDKARRAIEAAERAINELVLKAPRDGVIVIGTHPWENRRFQIGDMVQPGFTILTLPDLTEPMEVAAELSDVDDGRVAVGAKGHCVLDAYPREPIPCAVAELAPVARAVQFQSTRRVFAVRLALETSDPERMRPGMSVKVELAGPAIPAGLVVPRGAIVFDAEQPPRLRLAGGELREVAIAGCDAQRCAIESGASEGDTVWEGEP
jgi:HlyD family secretion protein